MFDHVGLNVKDYPREPRVLPGGAGAARLQAGDGVRGAQGGRVRRATTPSRSSGSASGSRSAPARTSRSPAPTVRPSTPSTPPRSPQAEPTTARPASASTTTRPTTPPSSTTPTGTTSRPSATLPHSRGSAHDTAVPRRPRRQPAPPARPARGARTTSRQGRIGADQLRAVEDDAIRDAVRLQEDAGLRGRDRRRVPPRLVAHGLHLPAGRHEQGARRDEGAVLQRGRHDRVHARRAPRRRADRPRAHDLRRRLRLPPRDGDGEHAEADDPVAEHGPLPRRARRHRPRPLSRPRRVLGRPDGGVRGGGAAARGARLHVSPVRRHEPRVPQRPASARLRRVDRRRSRPAARRVHPPHQRGARRPARTAWP